MKRIKENELIREVASNTGITIQIVDKVIQDLKETIIDNLRNNFQVHLIGFGFFEPFTRHKRYGINPRNIKEKMLLNEIRIAKFRTGYKMKRLMRKK